MDGNILLWIQDHFRWEGMGELVRVAQIIANANGNVIKLDHNQFVSINRKATVELRITIEAFGHEHKDQIVSELEKNGLRPRLVKVNI